MASQSANRKDTANWSKDARAMNEAGRRLQAQYGEREIPTADLQRLANEIGGYSQGSLLPSDYCYKLINKAEYSFQFPVLIHTGHGFYRYVGPEYPYTGPIVWRPKGKEERQVGQWQDGVFTLMHDPRT